MQQGTHSSHRHSNTTELAYSILHHSRHKQPAFQAPVSCFLKIQGRTRKLPENRPLIGHIKCPSYNIASWQSQTEKKSKQNCKPGPYRWPFNLKKTNPGFQISYTTRKLLLTCVLFGCLPWFRWLYDVCWPRSHDIVTEMEIKVLVKF